MSNFFFSLWYLLVCTSQIFSSFPLWCHRFLFFLASILSLTNRDRYLLTFYRRKRRAVIPKSLNLSYFSLFSCYCYCYCYYSKKYLLIWSHIFSVSVFVLIREGFPAYFPFVYLINEMRNKLFGDNKGAEIFYS